MTAEKKLARQRLSVLQLAKTRNNVSEACRQRGVSCTQFYEYKRRFQMHGLEGLKGPATHPSQPSLDHGAGGRGELLASAAGRS